MKNRPWSAAELQLLRDHYADSHTDDLAEVLGRTHAAVQVRALGMGLRKTPEYLAEHCRLRPGCAPWNTGKPGSTGRHPNTRAHQFRPGALNGRAAELVLPLGTLRTVAGCLQRKVADTPGPNHRRWRSVHELVWIAAHGPVPAGHVVVFRVGQQTAAEAEITLDRLELVSRADLMRRNSVHRHGPEIAGLSRLKGVLMRQIRRHEAAAEERA